MTYVKSLIDRLLPTQENIGVHCFITFKSFYRKKIWYSIVIKAIYVACARKLKVLKIQI